MEDGKFDPNTDGVFTLKRTMENPVVMQLISELSPGMPNTKVRFGKVITVEPERIANINGKDTVVTVDMLFACLYDILHSKSIPRLDLEDKHTAAISSLLENQEAYLGGDFPWVWMLDDKGVKLFETLREKRYRQNTVRCPVCEYLEGKGVK